MAESQTSPDAKTIEQKVWYCAACTLLIKPAGSPGVVNASGKHYCETCALIGFAGDSPAPETAGVTPAVSEPARETAAKSIDPQAVQPPFEEKPQQPLSSQPLPLAPTQTSVVQSPTIAVQPVEAPQRRQYSVAALMLLAAVSGAMSATIAIGGILLYLRPDILTVLQQPKAPAQPVAVQQQAEPERQVPAISATTETVPETAKTPNPDAKPIAEGSKPALTVKVLPIKENVPELEPHTSNETKQPGVVEADAPEKLNPAQVRDPNAAKPELAPPPLADKNRLEFAFQNPVELEQWTQIETGWAVANGNLSCSKPALNQRIEFSKVFNEDVVVSYEGKTPTDMGISFVDANDSAKFDRVIVGGMKGENVGFISPGKSKAKLTALKISDNQPHQVIVKRANGIIELSVDGNLVATSIKDQMYNPQAFKLRLHLWDKPGSFSKLSIQTLPEEKK